MPASGVRVVQAQSIETHLHVWTGLLCCDMTVFCSRIALLLSLTIPYSCVFFSSKCILCSSFLIEVETYELGCSLGLVRGRMLGVRTDLFFFRVNRAKSSSDWRLCGHEHSQSEVLALGYQHFAAVGHNMSIQASFRSVVGMSSIAYLSAQGTAMVLPPNRALPALASDSSSALSSNTRAPEN